MEVFVVHNNFSIHGGAERLMVCLANALASEHNVTVVTTAVSPTYRFHKSVRIMPYGWPAVLPITPACLVGLLITFYLAIRALLNLLLHNRRTYDLVISDQSAAINPVLRCLGSKVFFYCHFPDELLVTSGRNAVTAKGDYNEIIEPDQRRITCRLPYRWCLDRLNRWGMQQANLCFCNSRFTLSKFRQVYDKGIPARVLYPCVPDDVDNDLLLSYDACSDRRKPGTSCPYLLSLNRFEDKKRHERAITAVMKAVREHGVKLRLVCCGGAQSPKEWAYLDTLRALADNTDTVVQFVVNCSDQERRDLLRHSSGVIYTPSNEHFGIVPLEAMAFGKPVIAVNSGGPKETVQHNVTGWLVDNEAEMVHAILALTQTSTTAIATQCRAAAQAFSFSVFRRDLKAMLTDQ